MRPNADFGRRFNLMTSVQMAWRKYSTFVFKEIDVLCAHTASGRGRIAVVTTREAGSDGRNGPQHSLRGADERFGADGEVVWS
jgi:hypothetical protein